MKLFFNEFPNLQALPANLSWTAHTTIINRCKTVAEKSFYRLFTERENWSSRELERQIDTDLCLRVV